jgi:transcriptional regulator with XRE-family HTH domain
MNPIQQLRRQAGITQQVLAARAGTSQPTVAAYESGAKSPTVRTVERMAAALDLEPVLRFAPRMSYADHRSLALHSAIVEKIRNDPKPALRRAKKHLRRLRDLHPHANVLLKHWSAWLRMPFEDLAARMTGSDVLAREMRQVSPFAGVLDPEQRMEVLKAVRREHRP